MSPRIPRREFLVGMGALAGAAAVSSLPCQALPVSECLYPPADLSYFDKPISHGAGRIQIGYAAITWGGNDREAIADIASVGYPGIQLRSNCITEFASATEVRELLAKNKLTMVALSSGSLHIEPAVHDEQISTSVAHAQFTHDIGGPYLQVTDSRPKDHTITGDDYKRLGQLLTEVGKRTADLGVTLGYHNHMGTLSEHPEALDQILAAADPRYAKLLLDVGHYYQGGGDPAKAIEQYADRLLFLHIKDVAELPPGDPKHTYQWVELGRGKVDIPGVFAALKKVKFRGWAVIELDGEPKDSTRTPKESAAANEQYIEEKIGIKV